MGTLVRGLCMATVLLVVDTIAPAFAAPQAALVKQLRGTAQAVAPDGRARALEQGDRVFAGERVNTGARSHIKMRFSDGSRFELGSNAAMNIDKYSYEPKAPTNQIRTNIVKGVFRFLTGLIARARPKAMGVQLSVATIGIRGTHVVGEVKETSARVILLEPEDAVRPTSIEVANDFGNVVIDEPGFGTEIPDEHSPPSPPRRMRLQTINNIMRSLQTIQRMNMPRPRMH